ncbi:MAG: hypothetical protein K2M12_03710 [Muribaculaceae bacterium]|nr:hypothetical protein [Muribaculaceae bacterium]
MLSNKVKRNIWLTLGVLSLVAIADRAINVATGAKDWGSLVCAVIITMFCTRYYLYYRRQVKAGNLFGAGDPFRDR